jgi:hypothetical protein
MSGIYVRLRVMGEKAESRKQTAESRELQETGNRKRGRAPRTKITTVP